MHRELPVLREWKNRLKWFLIDSNWQQNKQITFQPNQGTSKSSIRNGVSVGFRKRLESDVESLLNLKLRLWNSSA